MKTQLNLRVSNVTTKEWVTKKKQKQTFYDLRWQKYSPNITTMLYDGQQFISIYNNLVIHCQRSLHYADCVPSKRPPPRKAVSLV